MLESIWNSTLPATIIIGPFFFWAVKVLIYYSKKNYPEDYSDDF